MTKSFDILFIPIEGVGHINANIGIAQVLITRGHRVLFAVSEQWEGRLSCFGIVEIIVFLRNDSQKEPAKHLGETYLKRGTISNLTPEEKAIRRGGNAIKYRAEEYKRLDKEVDDLLKTIHPDIIFLDQFYCIPSVETSGIPWVWTWSANPLKIFDSDKIPPHASGEWKRFQDIANKHCFDAWNAYNAYVVSRGAKPLIKDHFCNGSEYLNIYGFPEELDYSDVIARPERWYRFDNFKRNQDYSSVVLPDYLSNEQGKLIFFSLGSMCGTDVMLMKRLITILAKCEHRIIVSKGPLHERVNLAANMWGEKTVPQIQVLPIVDLVITHGGNNTVTETFFYGKPLIVLPLFADQYDNAQRIHDKGFGIRLDPYECTEYELLTAIEMLLKDNELNDKLKTISKRIQSDNSIAKLPDIVESLLRKFG